MDASVGFTYVQSGEVSKLATLAAMLNGALEMNPERESKTQTVDVSWRNVDSSEAIAALTLMLAAQDNKSPNDVLDHVRKIIESFGFQAENPFPTAD